VNDEPPLRAMNSCPASSKVAVISVPSGPGPASPYRLMLTILESGKIEV
jgi:hypothetical protein